MEQLLDILAKLDQNHSKSHCTDDYLYRIGDNTWWIKVIRDPNWTAIHFLNEINLWNRWYQQLLDKSSWLVLSVYLSDWLINLVLVSVSSSSLSTSHNNKSITTSFLDNGSWLSIYFSISRHPSKWSNYYPTR